MNRIISKVCIATAGLYAIFIVLWFILHLMFGDSIWWLALLNVFAPFFFLPLIVLLPLSIFWRRRSVWLSTVLPVLVFLWLYGRLFWPFRPQIPITTEVPFTVMSFNIWGGSRSAETVQVIRDSELPDVVAIQELTPEMVEVLVSVIGDVYPYRLLSAGAGYKGLGILSRYPLTEIDSASLDDPNWQVQIAQIVRDNHAFTFYNVHTQSSNLLLYLQEGSSVADEVQTSFRIRQSLTQRLMADIANRNGAAIVAGDFNSTDQSEVYALLTQQLADAHVVAGWGFGHTFPAYAGNYRGIPIPPLEMRLDMILYSRQMTALSSWTGTTYGESDHLPVFAKLAWLNP